MIEPLLGLEVRAAGSPLGPARRAGRALGELGAKIIECDGNEALLADGHELRIEGSTRALDAIGAEYLGLVAGAGLLGGATTVDARGLVDEMRTTIRQQGHGARLVRARDGWLVASWRAPDEARLLRARLGAPPADRPAAAVWRAARECRLLVSPVLSRPRVRPTAPAVTLRDRGLRGGSARSCEPLRVVDWTSLWAGPWATAQLADEGDEVVRVEVPGRRDGLLGTPEGTQLWHRFNGGKRLVLADARRADDRRQIETAIRASDVVVSAHTPRVLPQLGFDNAWFARHAPRAFRLELVAYEPPFDMLPGLGEQGAAMAGLLYRGGRRPRSPRPWADPLLGAWALLVIRAWRRGGCARGVFARLSLEAAAARVLVGVNEAMPLPGRHSGYAITPTSRQSRTGSSSPPPSRVALTRERR